MDDLAEDVSRVNRREAIGVLSAFGATAALLTTPRPASAQLPARRFKGMFRRSRPVFRASEVE